MCEVFTTLQSLPTISPSTTSASTATIPQKRSLSPLPGLTDILSTASTTTTTSLLNTQSRDITSPSISDNSPLPYKIRCTNTSNGISNTATNVNDVISNTSTALPPLNPSFDSIESEATSLLAHRLSDFSTQSNTTASHAQLLCSLSSVLSHRSHDTIDNNNNNSSRSNSANTSSILDTLPSLCSTSTVADSNVNSPIESDHSPSHRSHSHSHSHSHHHQSSPLFELRQLALQLPTQQNSLIKDTSKYVSQSGASTPLSTVEQLAFPQVKNTDSALCAQSPSDNPNGVTVKPVPLAQITLSTRKVFKFRTFSLNLEISNSLIEAHNLTDDDILKAGINAKCYTESGSFLYSCHCNPRKKIIEVGISNKLSFRPQPTGHGTKIYTFDACKTNCSSSRDHHKSNLVIVIDTLPGTKLVTSPSFAVQAREKQHRPSNTPKAKTPEQNTQPTTTTTVTTTTTTATTASLQQQQQNNNQAVKKPMCIVSTPPPMQTIPASQLFISNNNTNTNQSSNQNSVSVPTSMNSPLSNNQFYNPATIASTSVTTSGPLTTTTTISSTGAPLTNSGNFTSPSITSVVTNGDENLSKVSLVILSTALSSEDSDKLLRDLRGKIQQIKGFQQYKYSILPGEIIIFAFFASESQHHEAVSMTKNYLMNMPQTMNVFNTDLIASRQISINAICSSW